MKINIKLTPGQIEVILYSLKIISGLKKKSPPVYNMLTKLYGHKLNDTLDSTLTAVAETLNKFIKNNKALN